MTSNNNHILIVGSTTRSLVNFRAPLIKGLISKNIKVSTFSGEGNEKDEDFLRKLNVNHLSYNYITNRINLLHDFLLILRLRRHFKKIKPNIVLAYTIKPILFSSIALIGTKIKFIPLITGLGYIFYGESIFKIFMRGLIKFLFKIFLRKSNIIIFQNKDNLDYFINNNIVNKQKKIIIPGSGVNLKKYSFSNIPKSPIKFLMVSRLLYEKGVIEYLKAAEIVKKKFPKTEFCLVGGYDKSYDGISPNDISKFIDNNTVNYLGYKSNVFNLVKNCHIFVLPSYHEGMPKSVLEAMSVGRPIITTNTSGCRDTVKNGKNGFLVDIKDINAISKKMIWFINNPNKLRNMGSISRRIVEEKYDERIIVKLFLNVIKSI